MLLSPNDKIIFIHIPKTAGTAITNTLKRHIKGGNVQYGSQKHPVWSYHEDVKGFKSKLNNYEDYFKFSFVRNPWDRLLSWCSMLLKFKPGKFSKDKFKSWVLSKNNGSNKKSQLEWLTDENGNLTVDFIGKFEKLEMDYHKVCHLIGIPKDYLCHNRVSYHPPYQEVYDQEMIDHVLHYFKRDIEMFKYKF